MICPYCKKEAPWVDNKLVYGRRYGKSYMCYWCKECDAYVGCHNNGTIPFGTMANRELRQWRMKAHRAIDPLWQERKVMTRERVYNLLRELFGRQIHIGESDVETCKKIISLMSEQPKLL